MRYSWLIIPLPPLIWIAIVMVIARTDLIDIRISLHGDIDVIIIMTGISISVILSSIIIFQRQVQNLYQKTMGHARETVHAEHVRFLRRLDHELKNPITAIRAALANLADIDDRQERKRIRESIEVEALRLSALVENLRKITNLETQPLELLSINVADLLRESLLILKDDPVAQTLNYPLKPAIDTQAPLIIRGDHDLLMLALYNLLNNAIKFSKPGDTLGLRAFSDGNTVSIEVVDEGRGIKEADLPYVLEELYRGEDTLDIPGMGIGLSLVRAVMDRHYGTIEIKSVPRTGTKVTLHLPKSVQTDIA
jgi:two-component system OmpR family sensor kinase